MGVRWETPSERQQSAVFSREISRKNFQKKKSLHTHMGPL